MKQQLKTDIMQLKQGSTLQGGKYRIIQVLGQGGFGITYLAEHTMLDKQVAIRGILFLLLAILWSVQIAAETFVVCVGIGSYADAKVQNLMKTEKDAKSMAEFFKKGTPNVITITGKYATKQQILKSIRSQFGRAGKGDKIIFYFSGHGYPGGFCPYEMSKIEVGLTYADVLNVMKTSEASDKFIFADACNSGAIRQGNKAENPETGNVLMFLSSRGNEYSIESPFLANGYFTKNLLRGLGGAADSNGDRCITASELFQYVSKGVKEDTKDRQHPVMWGNFPDDLVIVSYSKR